MFQFFSPFGINETQVRAMGLTDLLNIELYNDNLKQFNQAWEELLLSLDKGVDGEMLEYLCKGQIRRSSVMENGLSLYHSDILLKRELKSYRTLTAMVNDIFEDWRQNQLISQNERSRDRAAPAHASRYGERKGRDRKSWTSKGWCSKGSKFVFEHHPLENGKRQRTRIKKSCLQWECC